MRRLLDFKPPKPNRFLLSLCKVIFPWHLKFFDHLAVDFVVQSPGVDKFLKDKSVIIFMNHPDRHDPVCAIALAKYLNEDFYTVVAREVFDWDHGLRGWFFQRIGCYSVNRGIADIRSIHTTKKLLSEGRRKLVAFPEAEVTGDTLSVHEVQSSLMHLLLDTQKSIAKNNPDKSVWILPVAISYRLETDLESSVSKTLDAVEKKLGIRRQLYLDALTRTGNCVDAILGILSNKYGCVLAEDQPKHEQVKCLVECISRHLGGYVDLKLNSDLSIEQQLHCLRAAVAKRIEEADESSPYCAKIWKTEVGVYMHLLEELDRAERLIIFHRILDQPTNPFQICRIVDFLEAETCGRMSAKGEQRAIVCLGHPIEVSSYLADYNKDKQLAINELAHRAKQALQTALDEASSNHGAPAVVEPQPSLEGTSVENIN